MKRVFVLAFMLVSLMGIGRAQQVFTSITPDHTYLNQPVTVTITGRGFKSGMVLLISGPAGSLPMATKVVNQYKATAVVDGTILQSEGIKRIYLLNRQGLIDSGEEYFQVCSFPVIQPPVPVILTLNDGTVGQPYSYQFTYTGGCQ